MLTPPLLFPPRPPLGRRKSAPFATDRRSRISTSRVPSVSPASLFLGGWAPCVPPYPIMPYPCPCRVAQAREAGRAIKVLRPHLASPHPPHHAAKFHLARFIDTHQARPPRRIHTCMTRKAGCHTEWTTPSAEKFPVPNALLTGTRLASPA